jgi:hypothetical protein
VQFKVVSLPLSSFLFILSGFSLRSELFRQERAGSSERSEKPDKRKEKEERGKIPALTQL